MLSCERATSFPSGETFLLGFYARQNLAFFSLLVQFFEQGDLPRNTLSSKTYSYARVMLQSLSKAFQGTRFSPICWCKRLGRLVTESFTRANLVGQLLNTFTNHNEKDNNKYIYQPSMTAFYSNYRRKIHWFSTLFFRRFVFHYYRYHSEGTVFVFSYLHPLHTSASSAPFHSRSLFRELQSFTREFFPCLLINFVHENRKNGIFSLSFFL